MAAGAKPEGAEKKLVAGILGILLGTLGIHKFYLGYQKEGIIMLVVALVGGTITCGIGAVAVQIIGIVEEKIAHFALAESPVGLTQRRILKLIREAGKIPVRRNALYDVLEIHDEDGNVHDEDHAGAHPVSQL